MNAPEEPPPEAVAQFVHTLAAHLVQHASAELEKVLLAAEVDSRPLPPVLGVAGLGLALRRPPPAEPPRFLTGEVDHADVGSLWGVRTGVEAAGYDGAREDRGALQ